LLEAKNRELSQEPELLTGVLDWLLGINVNRSLARPIYATTPRVTINWRDAEIAAPHTFATAIQGRPYNSTFCVTGLSAP
ncbi:MAG: hypothetical protein VB124_02380, partial [Burkholderia sp.]